MSNNNEQDDKLTVSQVYNTLKSPKFLKNLYWGILSDIKEKDTYKLIRDITEGVINQNMEVLNGLNCNTEADNMRMKTIVAEISVMSYTIDRVFSKVLYMKLEKACKEQITKIIQELKDEGKISESVWSRFKMNKVNSESETSTENTVVKSNSIQPKKDVQKAPTRVGRRKRKANSNYHVFEDIKKANSNKEILDDLKKVNSMKYTDENVDIASDKKGNSKKKKSGGRVNDLPNEKMTNSNASSSLKKLTKENVSILQNSIDKEDNQDDSDADSEISWGHKDIDLCSVSSVHTSDLSSFDDEISLSSDDEKGEKKKIHLEEAIRRYSESGSSELSTLNKTDANSSKSLDSKVSVKGTSKNSSQSATSDPLHENGLSKRARKPNSKYLSDNIFCPIVKVKERKKSISAMKMNENTDEHLPKKKVKVEDDIYVDVVTITQSINEGNDNNNLKTPAKQPETPLLFKSRSASRSLTSRRTAPLTLFST